MLRSMWLRVCMIVAVVTTAFAGTAWANDPITITLEEFTGVNDVHLDGNVHYTSTGTLENGMINVPYEGTFTVSVTNGLITSVSVASSWWGAVEYHANNGAYTTNWNVQPDVPLTVTSSNGCSSVTYKNVINTDNYYFKVCYLSVTYIPLDPVGWTLKDATNNTPDQSMGTTKVNGNVVMAAPKKGFGYAEQAFTVATTPTNNVNNVVVEHIGNEFTVTSVPEGTTEVEVTVNFAPHATDNKINFESDLANYSDWTFTNIERNNVNQDSNTPAHKGRRYGKATTTSASINTANPIQYPHIFSCWITKMDNYFTEAVWTLEVKENTEGAEWTLVETKDITNESTYPYNSWVEFSVDLTGHTNVFVRLSYSGSHIKCAVADIDLTEGAVPVSVSSSGLSTFCCHRALDFTNSSIKVYYATAEGTTLTFHQITKVPADTGVLLQKTGGGTEDVPPLVGTPDAVTGNVFVPGAGAAVSYSDEDQKYILYQGEFLKANSNKVATNRAYIQLPTGSQVKDLTINLEADVTGIETIDDVQSTMNDAIYNLAGQRLKKMQKGINIVNGKKMIQR